jgi:hypothetical protein
MTVVVQGEEPPDESSDREYLSKKLEEVRKDCQWILSMGSVGVLGVVLKDGFGSASPGLRLTVTALSIAQILVSMLGSVTWGATTVDSSEFVALSRNRLQARLRLRNLAIVLLAVTIVLIAILGWVGVADKRVGML